MQQALVEKWTAENNIAITDTQLQQLALHQEMVLEKNKYMNLTAITQPEEFAVKHIIDSLTLLPYIPQSRPGQPPKACKNILESGPAPACMNELQQRPITLADIGTGAGFPGMVLAIMRGDLHVTLVDSLRKRIVFLQDVVEKLGLTNVECVHARAEDLAQAGAAFDLCTARAVARMDKLVKWALPITKGGGTFLAMKGANIKDELDEAKPTLAKLGGMVKTVDLVEIGPGLVHSVVAIGLSAH